MITLFSVIFGLLINIMVEDTVAASNTRPLLSASISTNKIYSLYHEKV